MPNVWTHLLFGQHVLEGIQQQSLIQEHKSRMQFNMGCQGPDFLFYHRYLPWQKNDAMNRLGSAMHAQHCGQALMELLDAAAGRKATGSAAHPAVVYALGFVLHHLLDRTMHPYIFSRSGFRKWDHQRFEIMLDTRIVKSLTGKDTWKTPVWQEIDNNGQIPEEIVEAFDQITACHYPELAPQIRTEQWEEAQRDMIGALRLFHDPLGIRRVLTFGKLEPFVYKKRLPAIDIMNEARASWLDPTDNQLRHSTTVWEMWDLAMEEARQLIPLILAWFEAEERYDGQSDKQRVVIATLRQQVSVRIGNRSYETGRPCNSGAAIRYAESVFN